MKNLFISSVFLLILSGHPVSAKDTPAPATRCTKLAEACKESYHGLGKDASPEDYQKCSDQCLASFQPCKKELAKDKLDQVTAYQLFCKNQSKSKTR